VRFPSGTARAVLFWHPGITALAMYALLRGPSTLATAVAGVALGIGAPCVVALVANRFGSPQVLNTTPDHMAFYRYGALPGRVADFWARRLPCVTVPPAAVWHALTPIGRWGPSQITKRIGFTVNTMLPTFCVFTAAPLMQSSLAAFIVAIDARSFAGCVAQHALLALSVVAFTAAAWVLRPYRVPVQLYLQTASTATVLLALAASFWNLVLRTSTGPVGATSIRNQIHCALLAQYLQMVVMLAKMACDVPVRLGEQFLWKKTLGRTHLWDPHQDRDVSDEALLDDTVMSELLLLH
jgi:hypothetical protein